MTDKNCYIVPFFTKCKHGSNETLNTDKVVIRGMACLRREFDFGLPLYKDGKEIKEKIYYFHLVTKDIDIIEKAVEMVKKGLGCDLIKKSKGFKFI